MPLFEFSCKNCGGKFEELVKSQTQVTCPKCGSSEVTRLVSGFGFRSSGSASAASGGCAGCAGGSCASCH